MGQLRFERGLSALEFGYQQAAVICFGLVLFAGGCGYQPRKIAVPPFDPPAMAAQALRQKDANNDNALSMDELKEWPGMRAALSVIDTNQDRKADRGEIEQHFAKYGVGRIGLQSLTCFVMANGKPLSEAVVDFVPEPIFADFIKPARAITGRDGSGPVLPIDGGLPGVAPGIYRVTISKKHGDRELVPKKYNAETELGFEVSNAGGGAPAKFDIQSP